MREHVLPGQADRPAAGIALPQFRRLAQHHVLQRRKQPGHVPDMRDPGRKARRLLRSAGDPRLQEEEPPGSAHQRKERFPARVRSVARLPHQGIDRRLDAAGRLHPGQIGQEPAEGFQHLSGLPRIRRGEAIVHTPGSANQTLRQHGARDAAALPEGGHIPEGRAERDGALHPITPHRHPRQPLAQGLGAGILRVPVQPEERHAQAVRSAGHGHGADRLKRLDAGLQGAFLRSAQCHRRERVLVIIELKEGQPHPSAFLAEAVPVPQCAAVRLPEQAGKQVLQHVAVQQPRAFPDASAQFRHFAAHPLSVPAAVRQPAHRITVRNVCLPHASFPFPPFCSFCLNIS